MSMTEAEALTKWCPMARTLYTDGQTFAAGVNRNTGGEVTPSDCCLGSRCMAWRWTGLSPVFQTSRTPVEGWEHVSAEDSDDGVEFWHEPREMALKRRPGCCSLMEGRNAP